MTRCDANPPAVRTGRCACSVVIPVFNDAVRLERCLDALSHQGPELDFEVLVVDNGSHVPIDALVARYPIARLLHEPTPGSYVARNAGVAAARGSILAFTDSDCRPRPDWLATALAHLSADPGVHAIGGRIELDRSAVPGAVELYERLHAFPQQTYVHRDGFSATANLVVRREVFEAVGSFNSAMRSGGDMEWGQRLSTAGFRLDYLDTMVVDHPPRRSLRDLLHKHRRVAGRIGPAPKTMTELRSDAPRRPYPIGMGPRETWFVLAIVPSRVGLRRIDGMRVLVVHACVRLVKRLERLRIRLGGRPLR